MSEFISLLSPQSCKPIRLGGMPGLSSMDIAHALSLVNGISYFIIQMKYMDDVTAYNRLYDLLSERIEDEAQQDKWKRDRLPSLVNLAIQEYTGHKIWKDNERAKAIGVHPSGWCRVWRSKYLRLMEILESYEQNALHLVRNRLKY